jgi:purine-nucleoside phosphorylase
MIIMSIHIVAEPDSVAEAVLLPGDPLRAQHVAQTFLSDAVRYNEIRGMYGYTGYWNGHRVSVQGTGMGMPSFSIYATELIQEYGAKRLVRIGTCGSLLPQLHLKDILIAQAAHSDGGMNRSRFGWSYEFAPVATFGLLEKAWRIARRLNLPAVVGSVFTSDQFYDEKGEEKARMAASLGAMAVDMETCELYTIAAIKQVEALTIMTVSDSLVTGENVPSEERQVTFDSMVELALHTLFDE